VSEQHLPIAVRGYAVRSKLKRNKQSKQPKIEHLWPSGVLIFDTETTTDKTQRFLFGSYRLCQWPKKGGGLICQKEGLIYADDLPKTDPEGFACLQEYAESRAADTPRGFPNSIRFLSRSEFVKAVFYPLGYGAEALIVGFNLPFDISRIAVDYGSARNQQYRSGFSFILAQYRDKKTRKMLAHSGQSDHLFRPIVIGRFGHCDRSEATLARG
jgi:hypothetical protein